MGAAPLTILPGQGASLRSSDDTIIVSGGPALGEIDLRVNGAIAGGGGATPVALVSVDNLPLTGLVSVVDGELVNQPGIVVFAVGQTDPTQNGPYVSAAGAWTRLPSFATAGQMTVGRSFVAYGGVALAGTQWVFATSTPVTVGTTALIFIQDPGAGALAGLTLPAARATLSPTYFAQVPAGPSVQSLTISALPNDVDYDLYCHIIGGHAGTSVFFLPNSQTLNLRSVGTDQAIGGSQGTAAWAAYTNNLFLSGITGELKVNGTVRTKSGRGSRSYHIQTLLITTAGPTAHDCTAQGDWTDDATVMNSFQLMTNEVDGLAAGTFMMLSERIS